MKAFRRYWIIMMAGLSVLSAYPLYMGIRVVSDMAVKLVVAEEDYPKYVIPYAPIAIAVIAAAALMPIAVRLSRRFCQLAASVLAVGLFLFSEHMLESWVIVSETSRATLESWQMYMCAVMPDAYITRTWKPLDILIGDYSPTFKVHFYLISIVLVVTIINSIYGFALAILTRDRTRCRALTVQSVCTALFLGLCILACFTSFYRGGELTVPPLSAFLMALFFIVLGVTAGVFAASFLMYSKKRAVSIGLPAATALLMVSAMYAGETFLLSGHLYHLGTGALFDRLPGTALAPADIIVILLSGAVTAAISSALAVKDLDKRKGGQG